MPIAPIQTSQPNCHCPLEGSPSRKVCCTAKYNLGAPAASRMGDPVCCGPLSVIASEAKQSIAPQVERGGLLRCARNDVDTVSHSRDADRPRFASSLPSSKSEGAGKTGCLLHPRSRVRFALTKLHTSIQGSANTPAFPAQWLYGLLRALPGERLFCLRRHAGNKPRAT
jgi:hypothetical protein